MIWEVELVVMVSFGKQICVAFTTKSLVSIVSHYSHGIALHQKVV